MLLCVLPLGMTHAAESKRHTVRTKARIAAPAKTIHWQDVSLSIKDSLAWLRDTTVHGVLPGHGTGVEPLTWNNDTTPQFGVGHDLFKSIHLDDGANIKKMPSQTSGLQLGRNTQFQWDVQRFWTVDDRQEVAVKLGVHFDFR
jgi:hypothetical protein